MLVSWVAGERERGGGGREGEGKGVRKIRENGERREREKVKEEERRGVEGKNKGGEGRKVFTSVFLQPIPKWSAILTPKEVPSTCTVHLGQGNGHRLHMMAV